MNESEYDRCLGLIYDAVLEPLRLKHALAAIIRAVNAPGAHLVAFEKRNMEVRLSAMSGMAPLSEVDYNERYARVDPRSGFYLASAVGEWRSCHQYLDQAFVDTSEFYQDFLIPYGSRFCCCGKLLENEKYAVFLGIHRGVSHGPLDDPALALLTRFTPHLQRAMQIIFEHAQLQNQWAVVKATLDMLDYGAFVCDETGAILVANEAALARAEEMDGIQITDGRIGLRDAKAHAQLRRSLAESPLDEDRSTGGEAVVGILVPRTSRSPLHLIARRLRPDRMLFRSEDRALWSVMISDPHGPAAPTMRAISMLYGLTPAESRIAALLVSGATTQEIAAQSHTSINTVYTQLKSLFAKTSTSRQAELVRLFSSPPALRNTPIVAAGHEPRRRV